MTLKKNNILDQMKETPPETPDPSEEMEDSLEISEEFLDDVSLTDIVIEIEEDIDDFLEVVEEVPTGEIFADEKVEISKHTIDGKHRLKYDTIFRGKKDELSPDEDVEEVLNYENLEVDKSSNYWFESQDNENYLRSKKVKEKIYQVLSQKTDINFMNNRRKPSKNDFNNYFYILKTSLVAEGFTHVELFNELSVYFSDNLFNMFKLLDNKWRNLIIKELQEHIGKKNDSKEISWRNITPGTEIEFSWVDDFSKELKITGAVLEKSEAEDFLRVDSYEKYYDITLSHVTQILNNTKFKNDLNKLNNLDFL